MSQRQTLARSRAAVRTVDESTPTRNYDDGHQLLMAKSQSDGKKGHGWGYDSFLLMSLRPVGTEKYRNLLLYSQVL